MNADRISSNNPNTIMNKSFCRNRILKGNALCFTCRHPIMSHFTRTSPCSWAWFLILQWHLISSHHSRKLWHQNRFAILPSSVNIGQAWKHTKPWSAIRVLDIVWHGKNGHHRLRCCFGIQEHTHVSCSEHQQEKTMLPCRWFCKACLLCVYTGLQISAYR